MTTATKTRSGVASWKKLLGEAEQLRGQAGVAAHRRAKILTQLFDDDEFRAERGLADDDAVELVMDELLEDLCLSFYEVRAMLHEFPKADDWTDGKLATLYQRAKEQIAARRSASDEDRPTITRTRITKADFEKLAGEKQDIEARLRFVDQQHSQSLQEIERLKLENAELKGRISELERTVNRVSKAA